MIGFLAVFGVGDNELLKIVELTRSLEESKPFQVEKRNGVINRDWLRYA